MTLRTIGKYPCWAWSKKFLEPYNCKTKNILKTFVSWTFVLPSTNWNKNSCKLKMKCFMYEIIYIQYSYLYTSLISIKCNQPSSDTKTKFQCWIWCQFPELLKEVGVVLKSWIVFFLITLFLYFPSFSWQFCYIFNLKGHFRYSQTS